MTVDFDPETRIHSSLDRATNTFCRVEGNESIKWFSTPFIKSFNSPSYAVLFTNIKVASSIVFGYKFNPCNILLVEWVKVMGYDIANIFEFTIVILIFMLLLGQFNNLTL